MGSAVARWSAPHQARGVSRGERTWPISRAPAGGRAGIPQVPQLPVSPTWQAGPRLQEGSTHHRSFLSARCARPGFHAPWLVVPYESGGLFKGQADRRERVMMHNEPRLPSDTVTSRASPRGSGVSSLPSGADAPQPPDQRCIGAWTGQHRPSISLHRLPLVRSTVRVQMLRGRDTQQWPREVPPLAPLTPTGLRPWPSPLTAASKAKGWASLPSVLASPEPRA